MAPTTPTTAAQGPQYNWVDVQRAFGPVQFNRIGFSITDDDRLALAVDGSVSLAGLTIALTGLSAQIPIRSPYLPTFGLDGLAVEYAAAGLERDRRPQHRGRRAACGCGPPGRRSPTPVLNANTRAGHVPPAEAARPRTARSGPGPFFVSAG